MGVKLDFEAVNALPNPLQPGTLYFVDNGDGTAGLFVTDATGAITARQVVGLTTGGTLARTGAQQSGAVKSGTTFYQKFTATRDILLTGVTIQGITASGGAPRMRVRPNDGGGQTELAGANAVAVPGGLYAPLTYFIPSGTSVVIGVDNASLSLTMSSGHTWDGLTQPDTALITSFSVGTGWTQEAAAGTQMALLFDVAGVPVRRVEVGGDLTRTVADGVLTVSADLSALANSAELDQRYGSTHPMSLVDVAGVPVDVVNASGVVTAPSDTGDVFHRWVPTADTHLVGFTDQYSPDADSVEYSIWLEGFPARPLMRVPAVPRSTPGSRVRTVQHPEVFVRAGLTYLLGWNGPGEITAPSNVNISGHSAAPTSVPGFTQLPGRYLAGSGTYPDLPVSAGTPLPYPTGRPLIGRTKGIVGTAPGGGSGTITTEPYDSGTGYATGAWVTANRSLYQALQAVPAGQAPVAGADSVYWRLVVQGGNDGADGMGFQPRGAWTTGFNYVLNDIVTNGGQTYRVTTAHTAGGTFDATKFELWAAKGADGTGGAPTPTGARVYRTATLTLTSGTESVVPFDNERNDTDAFHDNLVNNTRFTVPAGKGGMYSIGGHVAFTSNATGRRQAAIRLNGSTYIAIQGVPAVNGGATYLSFGTAYPLVAGDYLELLVRQDSGANLDTLIYQNVGTEFWLKLG